jgi:hypothetical protein
MLVGIAGAALVTDLGLPGLVLGWVAAGSIAGLLALWQHRGHAVRLTLAWVRRCWMFSWRYLVSAATRQGGVLVASLVLAGFAGVAAVGAVQGTLLALRPFSVIQIAALTAGTAEVARDRPRGHALRRFALTLSAIACAIAIANAAVLLALPDSLGELLLGDTWPAAEKLLIPAGISVLVMATWTGAFAGLLGDRAVKTTVALDVSILPVIVGLAAVGAALDDAMGYYWGQVAGQAILATAAWIALFRHTRHGREVTAQPTPPA